MQRRSYFFYPAALGLAGAVTLVMTAGVTVASAVAAALLAAAALGAGSRLYFLGAQDLLLAGRLATRSPALSESATLRDVCLRAMPVWAKQLDTSRRAGDEAVVALSQLFGGTVRRLSNAVTASRGAVSELSGDGGGMLAAIDRSDADLRVVTGTLENLQAAKDAVLGEVKRYAKDLKEMSQTVQHIAFQVHLLSFNAAIEAARAGDAGKSFSVVAAEMRELAGMSAEAGATMTRKVESIERIDQTLAEMFSSLNGSNESDAGAIARADAAIRDVMDRFKRLTTVLSSAVEIMESESENVGREISDALVQLQFQDRVSQIVAHVATNCTSLTASLERGSDEALDADLWMRDMAREFSTHEEFNNLSPSAGPARKTESLTFF